MNMECGNADELAPPNDLILEHAMGQRAVPTDLTTIGVDPNHWFPIARERDVVAGRALQVSVAGRKLVVFRTNKDSVAALEDRCCHRKVRLSRGIVVDGCITCPFHGWSYHGNGRLAKIPYWPAGRSLPNLSVPALPMRRDAGLYWVYLGHGVPDPSQDLFARVRFDPRDWLHLVLDRTFRNHFFLHRKYQPWSEIAVQKAETSDTGVRGTYTIMLPRSGPSEWLRRILRTEARDATSQTIGVEFLYPHHFAWMGDEIRVGAYFSPIARNECRVFIDMLVRRTSRLAFVQRLWLEMMRRFIFSRIQDEDAWIGEREQEGNDAYPAVGRHEVNPISVAVERLLWWKWSCYCENARHHDGKSVRIGVAEGAP
jgi:phenylpropionate dioxygenase-like ring-hydroxylating dioxygenase large terminal subunit